MHSPEPVITNNELIAESSPYLLQHAHNPVHWKAWNDNAWRKAMEEDKLVIVSIGYAACHWCHVMERECFEDTEVAKLMNEHFVSIKVDREERADVDQVYMDAVQIITGRGGWPLNAICLPDGRPLYAGTYFPKQRWMEVLIYLQNYFKRNRNEALQRAAEITGIIRTIDRPKGSVNESFTPILRKQLFEKIDHLWDYQHGGRKGNPKFPMPVTLQFLLQNYFYTKDTRALQAATMTLDEMMKGGIYDHAGGGFARYSVDGEWTIPHFEKMLYDNAQLLSVYAQAFMLTNDARYRAVVYKTSAFINRELSDVVGGYYASLDADSEGEEGKFYVWGFEELKTLLGDGFEKFCRYYDIEEAGNFEHGAINLRFRQHIEITDRDRVFLEEQLSKLFSEREKKPRPGLDNKLLTSWNAMMLKGFTDAYKAFGDPVFLKYALLTAEFLRKFCITDSYSVKHNYNKSGQEAINGFLEDYSFTIESFISLYECTYDEKWLLASKQLADTAIQCFYSAETALFFYTSADDTPLIARKTETQDNVIPSANSVMAKCLFKLGSLFDDENYINICRGQLNAVFESMMVNPVFFANWATLTDWFIEPPLEVAVCGEGALSAAAFLNRRFLPNCICCGSTDGSDVPLLRDKHQSEGLQIYICKDKTCELPLASAEKAIKRIEMEGLG